MSRCRLALQPGQRYTLVAMDVLDERDANYEPGCLSSRPLNIAHRTRRLGASIISYSPIPAAERCVAVRFALEADGSPGLLLRLLSPFARRDLTPDRMWWRRSGDRLHVEIALEAMPADLVHMVKGNLRKVIGVISVVQIRRDTLRQAA